MFTGVAVQIGTVVGAVLAMPQVFGTVEDWWKLYAAELVLMAVVLVFFPFFVSETPELVASEERAVSGI